MLTTIFALEESEGMLKSKLPWATPTILSAFCLILLIADARASNSVTKECEG